MRKAEDLENLESKLAVSEDEKRQLNGRVQLQQQHLDDLLVRKSELEMKSAEDEELKKTIENLELVNQDLRSKVCVMEDEKTQRDNRVHVQQQHLDELLAQKGEFEMKIAEDVKLKENVENLEFQNQDLQSKVCVAEEEKRQLNYEDNN